MGHIHNWATLFWARNFWPEIYEPQTFWPNTCLGHRLFGHTHNWATDMLTTRDFLATDIWAIRNIFAMWKLPGDK